MFILFVELSIEQSRFCRSWCHRSFCRMARMPLRALWTSSTPSQRLTALLLPQRTSTLLITAPSLRREDHSLLTASREPLELKYVPSVWLECLSSFFFFTSFINPSRTLWQRPFRTTRMSMSPTRDSWRTQTPSASSDTTHREVQSAPLTGKVFSKGPYYLQAWVFVVDRWLRALL